MKEADRIFMKQFQGEPCEICKTIECQYDELENNFYDESENIFPRGDDIADMESARMTCGHHIIPKARSKALRYDKRNIIVLCPKHHTMGNDMAPHSMNQKAVERFIEWFKLNKPEQYKWTTENEFMQRRYTYKEAVENMRAGREAWENE